LHRDSPVAKVRGLNPDASSGNATSLYCRAVSLNLWNDSDYGISNIYQKLSFNRNYFSCKVVYEIGSFI
jgi:hypothetical protein